MLWVVGQNPAVSSPNLRLVFDGLGQLDMLVVQEIWETETAAFWKRPGVDPKSINTEVLLLPAAFFMEKNGIDRELRRDGAVALQDGQRRRARPRPTARWSTMVFRRVRDLVAGSTEPRDVLIQKAFWQYGTAEDLLREINGRVYHDVPGKDLKKGDLVGRVADLQAGRLDLVRRVDLRRRVQRREEPHQAPRFPTRPQRTGPVSEFRAGPGRTTCGSSTTGRPAIAHGNPYPGSKPHRLVGQGGRPMDRTRRP